MRKRVLLEGAFAFVLIFTPHELCRRAVGQARLRMKDDLLRDRASRRTSCFWMSLSGHRNKNREWMRLKMRWNRSECPQRELSMRITRGTWENLKVAPRSPVRNARVLHFNELVEKMSDSSENGFYQREVLIWRPSLNLMKPSVLNLFSKR